MSNRHPRAHWSCILPLMLAPATDAAPEPAEAPALAYAGAETEDRKGWGIIEID